METRYSGSGSEGGSYKSLEVDFAKLAASLQGDNGEGITVAEIVDHTGWGEKKVRSIIRKAIDAGVCRPTRKKSARIDDMMTTVPSYIFPEAI